MQLHPPRAEAYISSGVDGQLDSQRCTFSRQKHMYKFGRREAQYMTSINPKRKIPFRQINASMYTNEDASIDCHDMSLSCMLLIHGKCTAMTRTTRETMQTSL